MENTKLKNLRSQVMENSEELQDFLRDLKSWEEDMKIKDEELRSKPPEAKVLPGIRKQLPKSKSEITQDTSPKVHKIEEKHLPQNEDQKVEDNKKTLGPTEKRISSYDYASWDKFDVEQALGKVDTSAKENGSDHESSSSSDENHEEQRTLHNKQKALLEKDKGNRFFSEGKYDDAIACYTSGILSDPTNAVLPANRAMALLKKGQLAAAEQDCTLSISLDYTYVKAFHRRGTCRFALKKFQLARQDFLKVLEMEPTNKFARVELDKLEQEFVKMDKPSSETSLKSLDDVEKKVSPSPGLKQVLQEDVASFSTTDLGSTEKNPKVFHDPKKKETSFFADVPDQVKPIYKSASKRSKKPLHRIPIDVRSSDEEELVIPTSTVQRPKELSYKQPSSTTKSLATPVTPLSTPSTPKSLPPIPATAFQFETDWRRLKHWPHLRLQYLQQLPPENLSKMYQQSIETDIFIGILHSVKDICQCDKEAAFLYLKYLTQIGRFATLVMFMDDEDTKIVRDVLESIPAITTTQEIENLKVLYRI